MGFRAVCDSELEHAPGSSRLHVRPYSKPRLQHTGVPVQWTAHSSIPNSPSVYRSTILDNAGIPTLTRVGISTPTQNNKI
eukprot:2767297-Rhodomonas_salina.2